MYRGEDRVALCADPGPIGQSLAGWGWVTNVSALENDFIFFIND
jgi:hypothetical protein